MKIHKNSKYPVIIKSFLSGVVYEYLKNHVRGSYEILCDPMTIKMVIQAIKNLKKFAEILLRIFKIFFCARRHLKSSHLSLIRVCAEITYIPSLITC